MRELHACPTLGIEENLLVDALLGRQTLRAVPVCSSQPVGGDTITITPVTILLSLPKFMLHLEKNVGDKAIPYDLERLRKLPCLVALSTTVQPYTQAFITITDPPPCAIIDRVLRGLNGDPPLDERLVTMDHLQRRAFKIEVQNLSAEPILFTEYMVV